MTTKRVKEEDFDPASIGLLTHYNVEHCKRMRRYVREDFTASGKKLPTYTNRVASDIQNDGIPEEWRRKLIHQTMDKMLKGTSNPRHQFWACIHVYLRKKFGSDFRLDSDVSDFERLGGAMAIFIVPEEMRDGFYSLQKEERPYEDVGLFAIAVYSRNDVGYCLIHVIQEFSPKNQLSDPIQIAHYGVGTLSNGRLVALLRGLENRELRSFEEGKSDFKTLKKEKLIEALSGLGEGLFNHE